MPVLNVELIDWVRQVIDENPERHEQSTWLATQVRPLTVRELVVPTEELVALAFESIPWDPRDSERPICQTQGCVAGWAAVKAAPEGTTVTIFSGRMAPVIREPGGAPMDLSVYAQRKMGLSDGQARYLFHGDRERKEVLAALAYLPECPNATLGDLIDFCGDANAAHQDWDG